MIGAEPPFGRIRAVLVKTYLTETCKFGLHDTAGLHLRRIFATLSRIVESIDTLSIKGTR